VNVNPAQVFWSFDIFVILLFIVGVYTILLTHNLIRTLIGLEILIKAATLLIIIVGFLTGNTAIAQAFVITLIVIEVVIMVVAGGVILQIFKTNNNIDTRELTNLKG
jgi:NADH-quinone oxidoreductase subunit K